MKSHLTDSKKSDVAVATVDEDKLVFEVADFIQRETGGSDCTQAAREVVRMVLTSIARPETFAFLKDFMERVNTQDNRATASPFFYQIQETFDEIECACYADKTVWYDQDEHHIIGETDDDLRKFLKDNTCMNDEEKAEVDKFDEFDLEERAKDHLIEKMGVREKQELSNFFFTEQACEQHIKVNGHNLRKPRSYVSFSYRNPELLRVMSALGEIAGTGYRGDKNWGKSEHI